MADEQFQPKKVDDRVLASPGVRVIAEFMDWVLIPLTLIIGYLIWFFVIAGRGQTPGKQIFGIQAVRQGRNLNWLLTVVRELFKFFIWGILGGLLLVVDLVMLVLDEKYQTFHDKIFDSYVVNKIDK